MSLAPPSSRSPISVLDRYIAGQLTGPFLFGVAAFSSILVSVGALFDLIRKMTELGLPLAIAARVFLLQLPEFVSLSFPMATLLSALIVYSRLSNDSELIALRSVGISIYRLVAPAIVLSLLVSALTFGFNEAIVPAAKQDQPKFDEKNIVFQQYRDEKQADGKTVQMLDRIFYAQRFDGQQMKGLTVLDFSQNGVNQIISANSAQWNYEQQTWDFFDGTIYLVDPNGSYRNILKFERQQIQLPRTPLDLASHKTDSAQMNIGEVQEYLRLVEQSGDEKRANQLRMRIQQKIAFPFVCLVFGTAGATLGTKPRRGGKGASFAISIVIIFTYYLLSFVCDAFGRLEIFTPILAAWLPTVVGLGAVSWLLVRAAK
jgi:lipopolysaccharide export system permease protein